jgi:hypothetical protein
MCFSKPKIKQADPVAPPPPPPSDTPQTPVLNEATRTQNSENRGVNIKRKGRSALTIPRLQTGGAGVNIPR